MSSIIQGYEYDIFISYRQKDNKYDGWITEFVNNLTKELEATFKEEVSVYFDINPHDGLLETHDVNASLRQKLKCLIFIPVISRTYCDTNSFAWQHEFCAFNKMAKEDMFGRDIKLRNGNVACRILPIQIHELDPEDRTLFENELGGVLRAVEFIYKESGVNRSLNPKDNKLDNLNKTQYRNQVNKLANAIKEIISNLKNFNSPITLSSSYSPPSFKAEINIKSIAVLPFVNMSSDPEQEFFSDGLTDEIITDLSQLSDLMVISRSSMMTFKGTNKKINEIAMDVNSRYVLEGSVRKSGSNIRITAQLIDSLNDSHLWSEKYTGTVNDVFEIQEKVSRSIVEALHVKLTSEEDEQLSVHPISNSQTYECYIRARQEMWKFTPASMKNAIQLAQKGLDLDKDNALLNALLGSVHLLLAHYGLRQDPKDLAIAQCYSSKSLELDPNCSLGHFIRGILIYRTGKLKEAKEVFQAALTKDQNNPDLLHWLIVCYMSSGNSRAAKPFSEKLIMVDPFTPISLAMPFSIEFFDGKIKESLPHMEYWLKKDFQSPFAQYWGAITYALNNQVDKSIELLDKIIRETPHLVFGQYSLFLKYSLLGQKEIALKNVAEELNIGAGSHEYMPLYMAFAFSLIGEKGDAIKWLKKTLDFGFTPHRHIAIIDAINNLLKNEEEFLDYMTEIKKRSEAFLT
jgi:non-specific serine/threonine protein kinase